MFCSSLLAFFVFPSVETQAGNQAANQPSAAANQSFCLSNSSLSRTISIDSSGHLRTTAIDNKRAGKSWNPVNANEFRLRLSNGTSCTEPDVWLTTDDFICTDQISQPRTAPGTNGANPSEKSDAPITERIFILKNSQRNLTVRVHYELGANDFFLRKWLEIESEKPITLEYVEVDSVPAADAYQPYQIKAITAQAGGNWRPGLGQPLYTTDSGTFWGVEFPAANNTVENQTLQCGYLWGRELESGKTYKTYRSVLGVADDPAFVSDVFLAYIDQIRIRPARLQIQYNSWFDYGGSVSGKLFAKSVEKIHQELVVKRNCAPLDAYVIDSGWQRLTDVTKQAFPVNNKFDSDFESTFQTVQQAQSRLGLWLSPGCIFCGRSMINEYEANGFESLGFSMSLCGPKYMNLLEKRLLELTGLGVSFFILDGVFGHLNTRSYELKGRGCPAMTQLDTAGFSSTDKRLNDPAYDELKTYYLVAGTERLIPIFQKMNEINPNVFVVISNGAWLSPWWLQYIDAVWMINAGDAASGSSRTDELVYRDSVYYSIRTTDKTQFPMVSLFNHEPKKTSTGESKTVFRNYLFMHLSRGTGFVELYVKPPVLADSDWDVLAEGLCWAREFFPTFRAAHMHGGDPSRREVYGYSGWDGTNKGYVSVHNPSKDKQEYTLKLDRRLGMSNDSGAAYKPHLIVGSPAASLNQLYHLGDVLTLTLNPGEVILVEFRKE